MNEYMYRTTILLQNMYNKKYNLNGIEENMIFERIKYNCIGETENTIVKCLSLKCSIDGTCGWFLSTNGALKLEIEHLPILTAL